MIRVFVRGNGQTSSQHLVIMVRIYLCLKYDDLFANSLHSIILMLMTAKT